MPDRIFLSTLIRINQRRMNQCIARDASTGSTLRRHRHYLQITSIHLTGYGPMLFPAFLLAALPGCTPCNNETLTTSGAGTFESQCPWYRILTGEIDRLELVDVTTEDLRHLPPDQREEDALVIFSRLAIRHQCACPLASRRGRQAISV